MRWCLFWLLLSAPLRAQSTPDSAADAATRTARLEGQVLSQTGEPVRKATLQLTPYGVSRPNAVYYTDTSDGGGNFAFEAVSPGRYSLSVQRAGYLTQNYGARSATNTGPGGVLTLAAGQVVKGLSFKLTPQGVIVGRVTDTDGDPLPGIQVQVLKVYRSRGKRRMSAIGSSGTDDQGSFRIANLSPGSYYLVADDAQSRSFGQNEAVRPGRAPNRLTNVATYYPDAVDAANAVPLEIAPGSELRGIEIQMHREAVFAIRGLVIGAGKPVTATLTARSKNGPESGIGMYVTDVRRDGTFEFRNMLPGVYAITAASSDTAEPGTAREEITVTDADLTGVKLTLTKAAAMAGTVKLEGAGSPVHPMIVLIGVDGAESASNTQVKDDGTFELHGIAPAKYAAIVDNLPDGVYVKSVRVGGQDVTRTALDLTSGVSGTLDILLSPRAAEVLGTVRNNDGEAMPGVQVTLWPKQMKPENVWSGPAQSATDQNGDFRITGLAPGEYYAIAWEELEPGLTYDLDFLKQFASQATTVTLEEGAHLAAQPKLISREVAAAEAAKLP